MAAEAEGGGSARFHSKERNCHRETNGASEEKSNPVDDNSAEKELQFAEKAAWASVAAAGLIHWQWRWQYATQQPLFPHEFLQVNLSNPARELPRSVLVEPSSRTMDPSALLEEDCRDIRLCRGPGSKLLGAENDRSDAL
eukprot:g2115.t1